MFTQFQCFQNVYDLGSRSRLIDEPESGARTVIDTIRSAMQIEMMETIPYDFKNIDVVPSFPRRLRYLEHSASWKSIRRVFDKYSNDGTAVPSHKGGDLAPKHCTTSSHACTNNRVDKSAQLDTNVNDAKTSILRREESYSPLETIPWRRATAHPR